MGFRVQHRLNRCHLSTAGSLVFRTCVATLQNVHKFGRLVASEAQKRGFYEADRQVFLGDGGHSNWTVHKVHFPHFTAVTDFIHVMSYLYEAAGSVTGNATAQWEQYQAWVRLTWQGQVATVIADLQAWQTRCGTPERTTSDSESKKIVAKTITYLTNNQPGMDYPAYRVKGLPITSSLVESLIKEINKRMKGTEKFWNRLPATCGAESMLQLTTSLLSNRDELHDHMKSRPGSIYYRRQTTTKNQKT